MHRNEDPIEPGQPTPDVSVIITTYHRERLVGEAIASVMAQQGVLLELVVVDDSPEGSAREAVAPFESSAVRYVRHEVPSEGRPGVVRNDAVGVTRAPFVQFLDDDDRLAEGALAALHGALKGSDVGLVFGRIVPFGDDAHVVEAEARYFEQVAAEARRMHTGRGFAAHLLFRDSLLVNSACMVRRDAFTCAHGYDSTLRCCEDVELFLRVGRERGVAFVDRDVVHYRVGAPSIMKDIRKTPGHPALAEAYARMHDRYRADHGGIEYRALQVLSKAATRLRHE